MPNPWSRFEALVPLAPTLVGTVSAHNADGTSAVTLPGGGQITAEGQTVAVGLQAYIKEGRVVGEAPSLPIELIEV